MIIIKMDNEINDIIYDICKKWNIQIKLFNLLNKYKVEQISDYIIKNKNEFIITIIDNILNSFPTNSKTNNFNSENILLKYKINAYRLVCKLDLVYMSKIYNSKLDYKSVSLFKYIINNEIDERKYKEEILEMKTF